MESFSSIQKADFTTEVKKDTWVGFWKIMAGNAVSNFIMLLALPKELVNYHILQPSVLALTIFFALAAYLIWKYPSLENNNFTIKTLCLAATIPVTYLCLYEGIPVLLIAMNFVASLTLYSKRHFYFFIALSSSAYFHWLFNARHGLDFRVDLNIYVIAVVICVLVNIQQYELVKEQIGNRLKLREMNNSLLELSQVDPLTKVYNRRFFMDKAHEILKLPHDQSDDLALIMFDIDHFKRVNDTYGHLVGDAVIIELSKRVQKVLRKSDILARYGGEEFIILLPNTDDADAYRIAERVREVVAMGDIVVEDQKISVTVSVGVSNKDSDDDLVELVKQADTSLYQAKNTGRNKICVYAPV